MAEKTEYITNLDLRQIVVNYMKAMAEVPWRATQDMDFTFCGKTLFYHAGCRYLGMVYDNNRNCLENFRAVLDGSGNYRPSDFGWDTAPGNSCATSIKHAWQLVSPDVEFSYSIDMMPYYKETHILPVGNIVWDAYDGKNTTKSILAATPKENVLESYAMALPGDGFGRYLDTGGHALMVTLPATVVRKEDGSIDPERSFVYLTDQNCILNTRREFPSSWKVDRPLTFEKSYEEGWLPVTIRELQEQKAPVPEFRFEGEGCVSRETFAALTVSCNYCITTLRGELRRPGSGTLVSTAEVHPCARTMPLDCLAKQLFGAEGNLTGCRILLEAEVGLGKESATYILK